ncbi:MAG: response regulator transcription factor [Eggerthellaceae bacterium]|nr:response regulator transcription factor [Eggerthellaceae bacterium]
MYVLIVEDDVRLADAVSQILCNNNYRVDVVHDGVDGLSYAETGSYDVIVLDVMLPKMNGFEVVAELRRRKVPTPVLMLTARDALGDKVGGLDSGADDYMTKPFAPAELMARLRSLTRRQGEVVFETAEFGDIKLDLDSCDLICNEKSIHLGFKEFSITKLLIANAGRVVSKETIIEKVWGYDSEVEDNNVEAYISFLRKKLDFVGSTVRIVTLRKVGYRLDEGE